MQSGISASADLKSAFQTFLSTPTAFALLVTIENESLVPSRTLESGNPPTDFGTNLGLLAPTLTPTQALYILLRRHPATSPSLAAVTYVPNAAPVRQKMLFASTQRTLVKDLGPEHFAESFFATEAAELTAEGWTRHERHVGAAKPLTQEERDQEGIREAESLEQGGMARRGAGYGGGVAGSSGVSSNVGEGVVEALGRLKEGDTGVLVQLRIDVQSETIVVQSRDDGVEAGELAGKISSVDPRYSFYRCSYADPSVGQASAVIFIYTCPTGAKIKERMVYASSKASVANLAESHVGLSIAKKLEASDPSDITAETIEAEFAPKVEENKTFAKPKRPGRR